MSDKRVSEIPVSRAQSRRLRELCCKSLITRAFCHFSTTSLLRAGADVALALKPTDPSLKGAAMISGAAELRRGMLITRDAHEALRELKSLVDLATEKIHAAELETAGMAVGSKPGKDFPGTLLAAVEVLHSAKFEDSLRGAVAKVETAAAWHSVKARTAHSQ